MEPDKTPEASCVKPMEKPMPAFRHRPSFAYAHRLGIAYRLGIGNRLHRRINSRHIHWLQETVRPPRKPLFH
jgi:hypothetical protein